MTRRPPLWRIALLLGILVVAAAVFVLRLPHKPARSIVGLSSHTATIGGTLTGSSWPEAMHDAAHTGTSPVRGPQTGHVRWTRKLNGNATPGPVVAQNGDILVATNAGDLHALDPLTGRDRWSFDAGDKSGTDLSVSPAVLPSGVIVWPTPGVKLDGISPAGEMLWQVTLHGSPTSPAISAGGVVIGDSAGWVYALDITATSAKIRWSLNLGESSYGSVSLTGKQIYQTDNDQLFALTDEGTRGAVAWRHPLPSPVEVSPAVTPDGGVVVGAGGTKEYGLRPTGTVRWVHDRRAQTYSSPIVTPDGLTAFGDHAGIVTLLDADTGHLAARYSGLGKREYPRTIGIWSSPVVDRDHDVYFATYQGHVQGFAADGRALFDLDDGSPVDSYPALTADGGLVVADNSGTVRLVADH